MTFNLLGAHICLLLLLFTITITFIFSLLLLLHVFCVLHFFNLCSYCFVPLNADLIIKLNVVHGRLRSGMPYSTCKSHHRRGPCTGPSGDREGKNGNMFNSDPVRVMNNLLVTDVV